MNMVCVTRVVTLPLVSEPPVHLQLCTFPSHYIIPLLSTSQNGIRETRRRPYGTGHRQQSTLRPTLTAKQIANTASAPTASASSPAAPLASEPGAQGAPSSTATSPAPVPTLAVNDQPARPLTPNSANRATLQEAFPNIDASVIRAVLIASGGQLEPAFNALLGMPRGLRKG